MEGGGGIGLIHDTASKEKAGGVGYDAWHYLKNFNTSAVEGIKLQFAK